MIIAIILILIFGSIIISAEHNIALLSNQLEEVKKILIKMYKDNS